MKGTSLLSHRLQISSNSYHYNLSPKRDVLPSRLARQIAKIHENIDIKSGIYSITS